MLPDIFKFRAPSSTPASNPASATAPSTAASKFAFSKPLSIASASASLPVAMLSTMPSVKPWIAKPARAPYAAVLTDLPTAVESFSPCNKSFVERSIKPAAAPPSGPPAKAAIVVNIPTAKLALPGFSFAQSLIFCIPCTTLLSVFFAVISFFSCSNFASAFLTGPAFWAIRPSSLIFASTFLATSTGSLATAPAAAPALPNKFLLSPLAFACASAPLKIS